MWKLGGGERELDIVAVEGYMKVGRSQAEEVGGGWGGVIRGLRG